MNPILKNLASVFIFLGSLFLPAFAFAETEIILDIYFPVEGDVHFSNDFNSPRGSNIHGATDIMAAKMNRIFAANDGVITFIPMEEPSWGFGIFVQGDDGYKYNYIHINNDTPGTDDGEGGTQYAYAPGIERGSRIKKGQHIAWVGDSGNAENVGSHLHFEIIDAAGERVNPYFSLIKAQAELQNRTWDYDPKVERELAPTISMALHLKKSGEEPVCKLDSLVKMSSLDAVYYCGVDGKRYAFPNANVYYSWYKNFSGVKTIPKEELGEIPFGGMVPYRPGSQLIKSTISPRVYAVAGGAVLRQIPSPYAAESIFGSNWTKTIHDLHDVFFSTYKIGSPIGEVE